MEERGLQRDLDSPRCQGAYDVGRDPSGSLGDEDGPPGLLVAIGVFLVSAAVLTFEVSLTRIFSVLLRFHFVFLAVSCAICGLGVGGMLSVSCSAWVRRRLSDRAVVAALSVALGLSLIGGMFVLLKTPLAEHVFEPLTIPAVAFVPFVLAGAVLSTVFHRHAAYSGSLYFADLGGAAVASLGVILILNAVGGINTPLAAGAMALAAGACFAAADARRRTAAVAAVLAAAAVALVATNLHTRFLDLPKLSPERAQKGNVKPLFQELGDPVIGAEIVATEWNAFARTDVVSNSGTDNLFVYTDGDVPTNMVPFSGDLSEVSDARLNIGYTAFIAGPRERVLLIGPGAGLDVLFGLMAGATEMVGVELNPSIPKLMYEFREMNGSVYAHENFDLKVAEGRNFIASDPTRYDLIYMALTKTATTATSGLALVESYVHTQEAFATYLDHLTDQGRVAFVTDSPLLALRAMLTVVAELEDRGVPTADACGHVALLTLGPEWDAMGPNPYRSLMLARRTPFSEADRDALLLQARIAHLDPLFVPGRRESYEYLDRLSRRGDSVARYVADYPRYAVGPVPDDMPFFIDLARGRTDQLASLQITALACAAATAWLLALLLLTRARRRAAWIGAHALGLATLLLPMGWSHRLLTLLAEAAVMAFAALSAAPHGTRRERARVLALGGWFAVLGAGFMAVEVAIMQPLILFLGYPTLTLSVILFGLLISGAAGSLLAQGWADDQLVRRVQLAAGGIAVLGGVYYVALSPILDVLLGASIGVRCLVTLAAMLPLGLLMGMPFPSGIRLARNGLAGHIPSLWGVNGLMSAAGSIGAMLLARDLGFSRVYLLGALLYLLLIALAPLAGGGRSGGGPTQSTG